MMHCFECAAAMPDNVIFCLNCGSKIDGESETVVRPPAATKPRPARNTFAIAGIALMFVVLSSALAVMVYIVFMRSPGETTFGYDSPVRSATPVATPTPEIIVVTVTPSPTRTPKPKPSATPINIDEVQGEIMDRETQGRNGNVALPPPTISEFDKNGRQLRAVCNNGEPSYWQLDKFLTCRMNGGVARWNRKHPKN